MCYSTQPHALIQFLAKTYNVLHEPFDPINKSTNHIHKDATLMF